jgi:uncharacterized protein VirK/YbjX
MQEIFKFARSDSLLLEIISANTTIFEQATRQWLYANSSMKERVAIVREHFTFLEQRLTIAAIRQIYLESGMVLWSSKEQEETVACKLHFERFYRKEGLLAIEFNFNDARVYSVNFWIANDADGEAALWIGALHGSFGNAEVIRKLTKRFFGYRPKNIMLYVVRLVARELNLRKIYAVSDYGSYVNQRIHAKRKLKNSLDDFWHELEGQVCQDKRFFILPPCERRKTLEEVVSHKRNQYRKRFAMLDEFEAEIVQILKENIR